MTETYLLFLVFVSFYVADCSIWLSRESIVFLSSLGRFWRPTAPHPLLTRKEKGLVLSFRPPPLAPVYLCRPLGISVSPQGFCLAAPHAAGGDLTRTAFCPMPFTQLSSVTARGRSVYVNGRRYLDCQTGSESTDLAKLLTDLSRLSEEKRAASLAHVWTSALDPEQIRADVVAFGQEILSLRMLCNALFLYLFAVLPFFLIRYELATIYLQIIGTALLLVGTIAVEFFRIHKRHWPTERQERFSTLLHVILYPPSAIRASDLLSHRLLSLAHPLAVASILCRPDTFRVFARRILRSLSYPVVVPTAEPRAATILARWKTLERDSVRAFLRAQRLDEAELLQPPPRPDDQTASYCPRCETAYTLSNGTCPDCPGVALMPYRPPHPVAE